MPRSRQAQSAGGDVRERNPRIRAIAEGVDDALEMRGADVEARTVVRAVEPTDMKLRHVRDEPPLTVEPRVGAGADPASSVGIHCARSPMTRYDFCRAAEPSREANGVGQPLALF